MPRVPVTEDEKHGVITASGDEKWKAKCDARETRERARRVSEEGEANSAGRRGERRGSREVEADCYKGEKIAKGQGRVPDGDKGNTEVERSRGKKRTASMKEEDTTYKNKTAHLQGKQMNISKRKAIKKKNRGEEERSKVKKKMKKGNVRKLTEMK